MSTIGLNIRGGGISNENVASYIINDLKPRSVVVINEAKLAAMLVPHVERVFYRMKDTSGIKDDDSAYSKHHPVTFTDALHNLAPPGCWLYLGNEFGSANLPEQNSWSLQAARRAHELGRKCGVHAQFTHHYEQGKAGWASQRSSIEETDAVLPHIYSYPNVGSELALERSGYSVLSDIRSLYPDKPIIITEWNYYHERDARRGPNGVLSDEQLATETEQAANYCRVFDADLCVYLVCEPNTEWELFNVWKRAHYKQRIAEMNRRYAMTQTPQDPPDYGRKYVGGQLKLVGASRLNFRSEPSSASTPVKAGFLFTGGEWVNYYGIPIDGWYKIEYGGKIGYVSAEYALLEGGQPDSDNDQFPDMPNPFEVSIANLSNDQRRALEIVYRQQAERFIEFADRVKPA